MAENEWNGDDRRDSRRRFLTDRRASARRHRFMWSVFFPIVAGIIGTGVVSWGAYVTHVTYSISANYEQSFEKYIEDNNGHIADVHMKVNEMQDDYNQKILELRHDLNASFKEMRDAQNAIYNFLIQHDKNGR